MSARTVGTASDERVHQMEGMESLTSKKIPYPKSVFLILATEVCERFSYYGMRTILTLYLKNVLKFEEYTATTIYHATSMLAFFTPLLGAILADSLWGKFKTILYLSVIYALGNFVVSIAAAPGLNLPIVSLTMVGLILIAIGTGGIKPCVAAFGGDQFVLPDQEKQLASFFSIFYFAVNIGSLTSTFVTPLLRKDVSCFGEETCYSLAFSVPAALMAIAVALFAGGKNLYRIIPPTGNIFISVFSTIKHALWRKRQSSEHKDHWLDHAEDKYSRRDIEDIKAVLRIFFLYIPLPLFWALFNQQGSTWTFQASRMRGDVGSFVFLPDQMQILNPALILILIPIFDRGIYPLLGKCGLLKKPLQRITLGGIFAGVAFLMSGAVELELQKTYPVKLGAGESYLNVINMAPFNITGKLERKPEDFQTDTFQIHANDSTNLGVIPSGIYEMSFKGPEGVATTSLTLTSQNASTLLITADKNNTLQFVYPENTLPSSGTTSGNILGKSSSGNPYVRVIQSGLWENPRKVPEKKGRNATLAHNRARSVNLVEAAKAIFHHKFSYQDNFSIYSDWRSTPAKEVNVAEYKIIIGDGSNATEWNGTIRVELGGSYILAITADDSVDEGYRFQLSTLVEPNSVHMLWLIPQYLVMTMGEIMFSITIMDFSYTQAPESMKSVMQSAWLMTVAFGNLIVVVLSQARFFEEQWKDFFLYAGLMFVDMTVFSYMAHCTRLE